MVRIHVGQPFDALRLLMACGRQVESTERSVNLNDCTSNGPELVEGLIGLFQPMNIPFSLVGAPIKAAAVLSGVVVYFLRLNSGQLYIGSTTDLHQRLKDHVSGQACRTTRLDPPIAVLRIEIQATFSEARTREAQLKRWSHAKKEALIRGDTPALKTLSRSRAAPLVIPDLTF